MQGTDSGCKLAKLEGGRADLRLDGSFKHCAEEKDEGQRTYSNSHAIDVSEKAKARQI